MPWNPPNTPTLRISRWPRCSSPLRAAAVDGRLQREPCGSVAEAWGFSSLLDIHAEVDQVQQDLHVPLRLHVAAHDAE